MAAVPENAHGSKLLVLIRCHHRNFPVLFACSIWLGALIPITGPMWLGFGALSLAGALRYRPLLLVAGFLTASVFAFNSHGGLSQLSEREWHGQVQLVSDPDSFPGRVIVDVSSASGRLRMVVSGPRSAIVRRASAGSRFNAHGSLQELSNPARYQSRHLRMSLVATELTEVGGQTLWRIPIDVVRSTILRGAEALPIEQQPVYAGFVIGDDRGSDEEVTQAFEASGLAHLLVVSGQNVIFVIAVVTPLISRLGRRTRMLTLLGILLLFAAVTRFEPSVLRATVMAMVATVSAGVGRPIEAHLRLALAVSLLLLLDPLLVHSFGFRLSVAATAGIAIFARRLSHRLRGPQWFRQVLAVTICAQLAVAPLIVPVFGPMPLAALPANVLAEPIAGLVMMWGSSVGLLAGIIGGWPAVVLQFPVRCGLWWVMGVANQFSALPLPRVGLLHMTVVTGAAIGLAGARSLVLRSSPTRRWGSVGG